MATPQQITDDQWHEYCEAGYLRLGKILADAELLALQQRLDEIMLGQAPLDYDRLLMQLDSSSGNYDDLAEQTKGHN